LNQLFLAMNPKVNSYLSNINNWKEEMEQLRKIVLSCNLSEELKWGVPCYMYQKSNIVLIHAFKNYCALLFFKGALLKDEKGILIQQTANVQSGSQIRFTDFKEIMKMKATLKDYVFEAIEVEKAGLKVEYKKTEEFIIPEEFQKKLDNMPSFKKAFYSLTPGRQRAYLLYFSGAKQPKTRQSRIESYTQRILNGIGFNDCVCGLSKKMPNCDGSHKYLKDNY
jgi:uncharacterized protein YdeI (YjbR/CyaY-like superfamily)